MDREQVFKFIKAHKDLIEEANFEELYKQFNNITDYVSDTHYLTDILIGAGIDPLKYMDAVPIAYLYKTDLDLKEINIPDNIKYIYKQAFEHAKLRKITIPKTIIKIGASAFSDNPFLARINVRGTQADVDKIENLSYRILVPIYD
ncbi:MAG: leucine-rich repeat protein [Romboutsia timonensis]